MNISEDIKLIQRLEKDVKNIKNDVDLCPNELSIFCDEMKRQYIVLAKELCNKRDELQAKLNFYNISK